MTDRAGVPRRAAALLVAAAALGCGHTRHVSEPAPAQEGAAAKSEKEELGGSGQATRTRVPPREGRPAVAASPEGLMNPGSAQKIQGALRQRGYLEGEPSGELDEATSAGLRKFQRSQGLAETGAPDRETLRRLGVDPAEIYRTVPKGAEAEPSR